MKYGIQITGDNGEVRYAAAAKGGYLSITDDISSIALFVQEESAIKALKAIRKMGHEPDNCVMQVVGVIPVVQTVTDVPLPPKKNGYLLTLEDKYYIGPAAVDKFVHLSYAWGNIERATFFKSPIAAQARLDDLKALHDDQVIKAQKEYDHYANLQNKNLRDHYGRTVDHYTVQNLKQWLDKYTKDRSNIDQATVEYV